jgi:hypothetical protein
MHRGCNATYATWGGQVEDSYDIITAGKEGAPF